MAEKFFKIDITKKLTTSVYLAIDDDRINIDSIEQDISKICDISQVVKETTDVSSWEFPWNPQNHHYKINKIEEIEKDEAELYCVFNLKENKIRG